MTDAVDSPPASVAGQPIDLAVTDLPDQSSAPADDSAVVATPGPWRRMLRRLRRDKAAMAAVGFLLVLTLGAAFASAVAPYDPNEQFIGAPFESPSGEHWFGTDDLGRDTFSRMVHGARISLRTGMQVLALALVLAVPIGLLSGFRGGRVDTVVMRIMDAFNSIPGLILALTVVGILGAGLEKVAIALGLVIAPSFVRLIRAQTLAVRQETFIEASESIGTPERTVLRKRILPNVASPLIVSVALATGGVLIAEAGLAILGFGPKPPQATWGAMLQRGYTVIFTEPLQILVPGVVLAATVLAFNTLGDGIRDALGLGLPKVTGVKGRLGMTSVKERPAVVAPQSGNLLTVEGLTVEFHTEAGPVHVIEDVTFGVRSGEVLGLVGESGSGKSVTSLSIMRLIPTPPGRIVRGSVVFDGRELLTARFDEMRSIRGKEISMVFQDPMTGINPAFTVGNQLVEVIRRHSSMNKAAAEQRAIELLDLVGIPDPRRRMKDYPYEMSGGMRQRALLAMALSGEPKLLIADEPTTALDVTVQAQILDLLRSLQAQMGMAVILVTHDLGVVADLCDRVAVMYAGQIVEEGDVNTLFEHPRHPYTEGLLGAIPQLGEPGDALTSIPGVVPSAVEMPHGCRFQPRCPYATSECTAPVALATHIDHKVRCVHADRLALEGVQ